MGLQGLEVVKGYLLIERNSELESLVGLDFVVYGPDGRLTDRSTFPSGRDERDLTQPVPHQCMTCHSEAWPDNNIVSYDPSMGYAVLNPVVSNICR